MARKCITNYGLDNKDNNEENNIPKKKSKTVKKKGKEKEDEEKAKNNGIFVIPLKEFKEKFKIITICQILFNSKIFSFPINLQDISGSFIYFKIELLQDTEFGITLYQDSVRENQVFYKEDKKNDSEYKHINVANSLKNQLSSGYKKEFIRENFDYFHSMQKGNYIVKINIEKCQRNSTFIINLIIKGQVGNIYYLKDNENNNTNLNEIVNFNSYVYGERTGELFEQFRKIIEFLKEYHKIDFIENGKGYYIETIFTNEVKTIILTNKKDKKDIIGSINKNDEDMILTGFEHENGKIKGKGAIKDLKNNKIEECTFLDNQIVHLYLDNNNGKDNSEMIISLLTKHNILKDDQYYINFCMDRHNRLFLKKKSEWNCNFCKNSFKNASCFYCKECNYFLCLNCYRIYCKIMFEDIIEVHIGFKKVGLPVQGFTDVLLFIPRLILPSNPLTHKVNIVASLFLRLLGDREIIVEFGDFKGEDIKDKNGKIYSTFYWSNEKTGLRFAEIKYEEYKNNILDYDSFSERIFELYPLEKINLYNALERCNLYDKKWNSDSYNIFFNNSKDFVAEFIRVTNSIRREGEEHRGYHNYSKTVIPKVILEAIENNEKDNWNRTGSLPIIGPLIGVVHFLGDKLTK